MKKSEKKTTVHLRKPLRSRLEGNVRRQEHNPNWASKEEISSNNKGRENRIRDKTEGNYVEDKELIQPKKTETNVAIR